MSKLVFSSNDLPAELDDKTRFAKWVEVFSDQIRAYDQYRDEEGRFSARFERIAFGETTVVRFGGTLERAVRTRRHVAADSRPQISIAFVLNAGRLCWRQDGQEVVAEPGMATVLGRNAPRECQVGSPFTLSSVRLPGERFGGILNCLEDFNLATIDCRTPVVGLLQRYLNMLLDDGRLADEPSVAMHVETTLVDLFTLALGAPRDAQEAARERGLRAARLQDVLTVIRARFADPAFSSHELASRLGISPSYIQKLLQESGGTFTERILELRLHRARAMLSDPHHDRMKVTEIALACGFNEVSYFNRCFRRRFGESPTQARGAS